MSPEIYYRYVAQTADESKQLGTALAQVLREGDLVVLNGGLGAGKTTFTQGLGAGLNVRGQVASPTFVIARVHEPVADGPALVHVDAYRLESLDEVDALDLDTSLEEAITVVEWGEGMVEQLSQDRLDIEIRRPRGEERDLDDDTRVITINGYGPRWVGVDLPSL